jgi:enterochelin esterase family protein
MLHRTVILLVLLVLAAPARAQTPAAIARAEAALAERPHAVDEVWRTLSAGGLPLVEPHPDDSRLARVTFAMKTRPDVQAVRLDSVVNVSRARQPVTDYVEDFTLPLQRIGGAPVWWIGLDVPRDVEAVYSFLVLEDGVWQRRSDPENPRHLRGGGAEAILRLDRAAPQAPVRPWPRRLQRRPDTLALDSDPLGRTVMLQLYRSPEAAADAPVLVLYDAFLWGVRAPAWEIAANLARAGDIPPIHVVLIDQLDPESAAHRYDDQARFLADELLPRLRAEGVETSPQRVILAGASRRGLAVSRAALTRPEAFGGVISLSGSFYWAPEDETAEWLGRTLGEAPAGAPRFHLAAGSLEHVVTTTNGGHVMLDTNRRFAAALHAAGYDADLSVFAGGHDIAAWRHALADGLVALLGE